MKLRWREFLVALFMAVALWYGITGSEKIESQVKVRMEYKGAPPGLVIRSGQVNELGVRIRASTGMLRSMADRDYVFSMDLSSLVKGLNVLPVAKSQLPFPGGVEVIEVIPSQVELNADTLETRKVPVKAEITGGIPEGRSVTAFVEPQEVTLHGPAGALGEIRAARVPIRIDPNAVLGEQVTRRPLALPESVSSSPTEVNVTLRISEKRRQVRLARTVQIEKPANLDLGISPERVSLSVSLPASLMDKAAANPEIRVEVVLPYEEPGIYTLPVRVHLPDGMELIGVEPAQVSVTLEQRATVTPKRKK